MRNTSRNVQRLRQHLPLKRHHLLRSLAAACPSVALFASFYATVAVPLAAAQGPPPLPPERKIPPAAIALSKFETAVGDALSFYRDGKSQEAETKLNALLATTKKKCWRARILEHLAMIKYRDGDKDNTAESLFKQALADAKCRSDIEVLRSYAELLQKKGLQAQAKAWIAKADKLQNIGTVTMLEDGTLEMRQVSLPPGPIAHGFFTYKPGEKEYASQLGHVGPLRPKESKPIPPWP